jgi:hypothetical protein
MKPNKEYFDASSVIAGYEHTTGHKASGNLSDLAEDLARLINKAFEDGYKAGMEAAHK